MELAETSYGQALDLAEKLGMRPLVAHCQVGLARLYHRAGNHEQAQTHLDAATQSYREIGTEFWVKRAEASIAEEVTVRS